METVLIADDEANIRSLVKVTIAAAEYAVLEAADGREAWRLMQQHRPVVALLDVQMPGMDGLELARAIRGSPELARTTIIMLTSRDQPADLAAGMAAGAEC